MKTKYVTLLHLVMTLAIKSQTDVRYGTVQYDDDKLKIHVVPIDYAMSGIT